MNDRLLLRRKRQNCLTKLKSLLIPSHNKKKMMLVKEEKTENGFRIRNSKSKKTYLLVLYFVVAVSFLFIVMPHQRGYQDAWILDGILVPTMIFIFLSLIAETLAIDNRLTAILAASFSAVLNLIPGLKYQLFYGVYDAVVHYGHVERLISLGSVPETGYYAPYYSVVPGMHLFISSLSLISGISVNEILRFIIPAIYGIIPLIIFFITDGIFDKNVQRYIIIASSFPIVGSLAFTLSASTFAEILYFLFIACFFRRAYTNKNKVEWSLALIVFAFGLVISHGVTSLFLSFLLVGMVLVLIILKYMGKQFPSRSLIYESVITSFFLMILLMTWWSFKANIYLDGLAYFLEKIIMWETKEVVPTTFYEIPLLAQLKVLALQHMKDAVIAIISLFGLSVFLIKFKRKELADKTKNFCLLVLVFLSIISATVFFQFTIGFGNIAYRRFLHYALVLSPFFAGLALWRLDKYLTTTFKNTTVKNLAFVSICFALFSLCLIDVFTYQPMVPRSNVLSKDLPEDEYISNFVTVNTVYIREMISHAERYSPANARITSDVTTRFQIFGFTDPSFSSRHIWHSPLEQPNLEWDLFLLRTDEKAGPFNENVKYHTKERINELKEAGSIIYDNGMSVITSTNFSLRP